jgi:glutaredoxin
MKTLASVVLGLWLVGCGGSSDGYRRAVAIEREILRRDPSTDYGDPRYLQVMRELRTVPRGSPDRARAEALWSRIRDGRRFALERDVPGRGELPERLRLEGEPKPRVALVDGTADPSLAGVRRSPTGAGRAPDGPTGSGGAGIAANSRRAAVVASPGGPAGGGAGGAELGRAAPGSSAGGGDLPQITLYSTSWCGYCKKARAYLTQRGWPFVEKDIERDPAAFREHSARSGGRGGVPVLDIGGTVIRGFDTAAIDRAVSGARP